MKIIGMQIKLKPVDEVKEKKSSKKNNVKKAENENGVLENAKV